jgi:hypothetical protein
MKPVLFAVALSVFSSVALAQGWVSSGGELFRDAKNPWFVRNTSTVTYCIRLDSTGFSADLSTVETAVKEGFEYWKDEFSRNSSMGSDGSFQVGTQSFEQVPTCSDDTDIQFLFGYQTLNSDQIAHLKDPKKFIGVTTRTAYDLKNLKGRGFLFFSSDSGPQTYDNPGTLVERAWSHPRLLKYAILHELGHVFGIPHMGSGLMSEVFLNQILNKNLVANYEKYPIDSFLRPNSELEICGGMGQGIAWFSAPNNPQCLLINAPGPLGIWKVSAKKTKDSAAEEIGEIRNVMPSLMDQRGRPAMILELNDQQKVFTAEETAFRSYMMGPMMVEMGMTGIYISKATKRPQPLYASMTPSSLTIQGLTSQSRLEPVFIFNSPISTLMMISPKPLQRKKK